MRLRGSLRQDDHDANESQTCGSDRRLRFANAPEYSAKSPLAGSCLQPPEPVPATPDSPSHGIIDNSTARNALCYLDGKLDIGSGRASPEIPYCRVRDAVEGKVTPILLCHTSKTCFCAVSTGLCRGKAPNGRMRLLGAVFSRRELLHHGRRLSWSGGWVLLALAEMS